jgi:hypothetical protein
MQPLKLTIVLALALAIVSCKKENNVNEHPDGELGNRLIKTVQITPSTGDTTTFTYKWNVNGELIEYRTVDNKNPTAFNSDVLINRAEDGKISKIIKRPHPINVNDSDVYLFEYTPGTNMLRYVINFHYTSFGNSKDSLIFTYNSAGKITSREFLHDFLGTIKPRFKQTFEYDGKGNLIKSFDYSHGASMYSDKKTTTYSFDGHKAAMVLGVECFFIMDPINVSVNNLIGKVTDATLTGELYTTVVTDLAFNSFDRPTQLTTTGTGSGGFLGHQYQLTFFYQQ